MSSILQTAVSHMSRQKRMICSIVSIVLCLVMIFSGSERAGAVGGDLDPDFNLGGAGADTTVFAVALQPDGKVLIGGDFTTYNGVNVSDRIARLNTDGTPDTSFNMGGTGANGSVRAITVQGDGKILIAGDFTEYDDATAAPASNASDRIARLNTDGTLDTSFNIGPGLRGANLSVNAVALQGDGKVLIGGNFTEYEDATSTNASLASDKIARLNTDGTLDTTFNMGGTGADRPVHAIAVQPDGKIIIGGDFEFYNGDTDTNNKVARLNTDGSLDTPFNAGGSSVNSNVFGVFALALQPDGKILIAGDFGSYNGLQRGHVARLNSNGTHDTGFMNSAATGTNNTMVNAIALQADGKILIGGDFTRYNDAANASDRIARLNSNGLLDTTFNTGTGIRGANGTVRAVVVQPDGKILIGGQFAKYNDNADASNRITRLLPVTGEIAFSSNTITVSESAGFAVIPLRRTGGTDNKVVGEVTLTDQTTTRADYRFKPGARDASFSGVGTGPNAPVRATAVQADGKILIGGDFQTYDGEDVSDFITRLNRDGTPDPLFNPGGVGADDEVLAIAVQADGKIIIGGNLFNYNGVFSQGITRLNANGTRDTTFNSGGTGTNNSVRAIAVQADGKILIGGDFTSYNGDTAANNRILRLNSNGSLDPFFNAGQSGAGSTVNAIAVQADGKILIGGSFTTYNGVNANDRIARLNIDGSLDTSFNTGGTGANATVQAVAVQGDGKILFGGSFTSYDDATATPASNASDRIARLNTNGSLDTSFNAGAGTRGASATVQAIVVQPNGKILAGGDFTTYNGSPFTSDRIVRLDTDGSSDTSFNFGAVVGGPLGANAIVRAIALQGDGKIVIGGDFLTYNGVNIGDFVTRLDGDLFVTWAAGDALNKTILLPIVDDGVNGEANESLLLTLIVRSGGATLGTPSQATLTISDPNDPPVNTVPGAQSTNQNIPLVFSQANGNRISVADVDAGTNPVRVTLTATNGVLTLSGTTGLSFSAGNGTNNATMTFTGTLTNINAALDGLRFNATSNGAATLQIATNDLGRTGTGGPQSDDDTVNITVTGGNEPNDPPVNTVPGPQTTARNTPLVFSQANGNQISIADPDADPSTVLVRLTATRGTVTLNPNGTGGLDTITNNGTAVVTMTGTLAHINAALNGLSFNPVTNFSGAGSLIVFTNDQGHTGTGGQQRDEDAISITIQ